MTTATNEDLATHDLVCDAVDQLRSGDLVLGAPDLDYAAGAMLEVLAELHQTTPLDGRKGIDLQRLPEVRAFALLVLGETEQSS